MTTLPPKKAPRQGLWMDESSYRELVRPDAARYGDIRLGDLDRAAPDFGILFFNLRAEAEKVLLLSKTRLLVWRATGGDSVDRHAELTGLAMRLEALAADMERHAERDPGLRSNASTLRRLASRARDESANYPAFD